MMDHNSNFIRNVLPELKKNALPYIGTLNINSQQIFKYGIEVRITQLFQYYEDIKNNNQICLYWLGLLTYRSAQESPLDKDTAKSVLQFINYFSSAYSQKYSEIYSVYSDSLQKQIIFFNDFDLLDWVNEILPILKVPSLKPAYLCLVTKLKGTVMICLNKFTSSPSLKTATELISFLKVSVVIIQDITIILNTAISQILDYLKEINDLDDFHKRIGSPYNEDFLSARQILSEIEPIEQYLGSENQKLSEKISLKIIKQESENDLLSQFQDEKIEYPGLNLDNIQWDPSPFSQKTIQNKYSVSMHRGTGINNQKVICKTYYSFDPDFQINDISEEINILAFLTKKALTKNCIVKLLNVYRSDDCIRIFMEDGGINLMDYLAQTQDRNQSINQGIIQNWVISLINAFAWLSSLSIYHCDIKPQNILVNQLDMSLKIIDFGSSKKTENDENLYSTIENTIKSTPSYMAPELIEAVNTSQFKIKYRLEKADVFSLGLTILKIIVLENLEGLNHDANNSFLIQKTKKIPILWIEKLVEKMLNVDRNLRPNFKECLSYLPADQTEIVS